MTCTFVDLGKRHEMAIVSETPHLSLVGMVGKSRRSIEFVAASRIKVERTKWLWNGRVPLGELVLLVGREGIGKSTVGYQIAADVTRGKLAGEYLGCPRQVIVVASEDSWERTIVPRLIAADADLDMVFNVKVCESGVEVGLTFPDDLLVVEKAVRDVGLDIALILLDPLISRIDSRLDTHKESHVRKALEPLARLCQDFEATCLGIIHQNKDANADIMTSVMGSRAFA